MNKSITLKGKKLPLNFGAATFYKACSESGNREFGDLLLDIQSAKPEPLFTLIKCAVSEGVRLHNIENEEKLSLDPGFCWEDIANEVGFDAQKILELIKVIGDSTNSQEVSKSEDPDAEKK